MKICKLQVIDFAARGTLPTAVRFRLVGAGDVLHKSQCERQTPGTFRAQKHERVREPSFCYGFAKAMFDVLLTNYILKLHTRQM
jgi:hypothetical protein